MKLPTHPSTEDVSHEPSDGYEPVSLWLIAFFGALLAWAGWYVGTYSGGFGAFELTPEPALLSSASQPAEDPLVLGKRLYLGNCAACHQADAKGLPGQYPPLAGSEIVHGTPAWMKRILLHGLEGPLTVKGQTFNGNMPAFGPKFSDRQLAAVISFERTNKDWGNNAGAVTPESVEATRAATKGRTAAWTASELLAIKTDEAPASPASTSAPATTSATTQGK